MDVSTAVLQGRINGRSWKGGSHPDSRHRGNRTDPAVLNPVKNLLLCLPNLFSVASPNHNRQRRQV
jgi:hypothetical protein